MYIKNRIGPSTLGGIDRMGGGMRPFQHNSLQSPFQKIINPGTSGSSDAVPVSGTSSNTFGK